MPGRSYVFHCRETGEETKPANRFDQNAVERKVCHTEPRQQEIWRRQTRGHHIGRPGERSRYSYQGQVITLGGMAFETEDDLISELRNWFDNLDVDFFRVGINSLLSRWQKCIDLHGDYVEK
ncbi:histone-lysine N-methyltransferase SETMAR [Plakobranchus ocellatus]|uniref:Histone-lysine N-methyltransferase SETMAR n=1 Tax=Plakobranchus ocellatus TaxID=259542 RepID=A0AAV3Y8K3_9GAST|nr:histone-lysine N-methyltransferase SETMAR [Plakobranchus ocellatus]